jgi:seryl-tRNA synthetase
VINLNWIIDNPDAFDRAMEIRGCEYKAKQIIELNNKRKKDITELQELQTKRNSISKEIGVLKAQGGDVDELLKKANDIATRMETLKQEQDDKDSDELYQILIRIPNILQDSVPVGEESNYKIIETWGDIPSFDFEPKAHYDLGVDLKMMDFEQAAYLHGSRSTILLSDLARLERALSNYFIDFLYKYGYIETSMPPLVKEIALFGTAQLPKFSEDSFHTDDDYWLIATSEITMTNLVATKIVSEKDLPLRYTACTSCFRSEVGSAGKDVRGMLRQFHFKKVEMVSIVTPDKSDEEHIKMCNIESEILKDLKLPFRTIVLATGDTGFASSKTFDHEVWLPSQKTYREISSTSNCLDFQSRRMNARYRDKDGKVQFLHTLNGSALPLGRTIIAIMENYQQKDGSILIPEVLIKYMNNQKVINKAIN